MNRTQHFKRHCFPSVIILRAVRMYLRHPRSHRDVADLPAERGVDVDQSTVYRRMQEFGPEIAGRACNHRSWRGLNWHVDETCVRVGGKRRHHWRAVDQKGRLIG